MPDVTCRGGCWGSRAGDHAELNPEKATNVKSTHRADQIWCQVNLPTSVLPNRFRVPQLRCDNSTAKPVTRPNNSDHSTPQSITDGSIAWKEPRQTTAGKYCDHRETEQHLFPQTLRKAWYSEKRFVQCRKFGKTKATDQA